jgi:hypothetical protein
MQLLGQRDSPVTESWLAGFVVELTKMGMVLVEDVVSVSGTWRPDSPGLMPMLELLSAMTTVAATITNATTAMDIVIHFPTAGLIHQSLLSSVRGL